MEGGCGVIGVLCSKPFAGRHLFQPASQMRNRGNGKGGGIAIAGFLPEQLHIPKEVLTSHYLLQIAFLDLSVQEDLEKQYIFPYFEVYSMETVKHRVDYQALGLEIPPPEVVRYFVRVRQQPLDEFIGRMVEKMGKEGELIDPEWFEDEFLYQNTYRINRAYYASLGEKKAFVLSHGINLAVFKLVGYAEQVIQYYQLEDIYANGWIAHQRYPTKGKVWHPGGAHPFIGLHEALVHNGDFANYYGVCAYLAQRGIVPLFLTDTEVSVLLFDLWKRVYGYPLEWVIEAMAPTTERDFDLLPAEKKELYFQLQASHLSGSPDGPWFFIILRSDPETREIQLMGITDTSMLRPQVFAYHSGEFSIGMVASEKQALDSFLESMHRECSSVCTVADLYWNARGGSHTDGGAFTFRLNVQDPVRIIPQNKFGIEIELPPQAAPRTPVLFPGVKKEILPEFSEAVEILRPMNLPEIREMLAQWLNSVSNAGTPDSFQKVYDLFAKLNDFPIPLEKVERKWFLHYLRRAMAQFFDLFPPPESDAPVCRVDFASRKTLCQALTGKQELFIDATGFPSETEDSLANFIVQCARLNWKKIVVYRVRGQRFIACGLGSSSYGMHIEVFGSPGDYLASGLDGARVVVHNSGQDQLGQILKAGQLVIYGDVGQTFLYGAKGGEVFVRGNAAGRPLINAVGSVKAVINGTCLDYLAESFMAGDPLNGGGFCILNAVRFNPEGQIEPLKEPYPGGNLLSLASGGAVYIRDPGKKVTEKQLNGGIIEPITASDWRVMEQLLVKNEEFFGIRIRDLLIVDGVEKKAEEVYRKILPAESEVFRRRLPFARMQEVPHLAPP